MKKSMLVLACGLLSVAGMMVAGCSQGDQSAAKPDTSATNPPSSPTAANPSAVTTLIPLTPPPATQPGDSAKPRITASGLGIVDVAEGTGPVAKAGDRVSVNYTGKLADGSKFDSSYDRNQPFVFQLGTGAVIPGWDEGIAGMKVGGKRQLIIPPNLGYGSQGQGPIPGNSTLYFDVELMGIAN